MIFSIHTVPIISLARVQSSVQEVNHTKEQEYYCRRPGFFAVVLKWLHRYTPPHPTLFNLPSANRAITANPSCIQHCSICRPSGSTLSEDAGIEPRTVATLALEVRRSKPWLDLIHNSARTHPHRLNLIHTTVVLIHTQLDLILGYLIHTQLNIIQGLSSSRSHPHSARSQLSSTTLLDPIHDSARSHPQNG
jgi:hypothetical protein